MPRKQPGQGKDRAGLSEALLDRDNRIGGVKRVRVRRIGIAAGQRGIVVRRRSRRFRTGLHSEQGAESYQSGKTKTARLPQFPSPRKVQWSQDADSATLGTTDVARGRRLCSAR